MYNVLEIPWGPRLSSWATWLIGFPTGWGSVQPRWTWLALRSFQQNLLSVEWIWKLLSIKHIKPKRKKHTLTFQSPTRSSTSRWIFHCKPSSSWGTLPDYGDPTGITAHFLSLWHPHHARFHGQLVPLLLSEDGVPNGTSKSLRQTMPAWISSVDW